MGGHRRKDSLNAALNQGQSKRQVHWNRRRRKGRMPPHRHLFSPARQRDRVHRKGSVGSAQGHVEPAKGPRVLINDEVCGPEAIPPGGQCLDQQVLGEDARVPKHRLVSGGDDRPIGRQTQFTAGGPAPLLQRPAVPVA